MKTQLWKIKKKKKKKERKKHEQKSMYAQLFQDRK